MVYLRRKLLPFLLILLVGVLKSLGALGGLETEPQAAAAAH
jgi:hypothetical protein